MRWQSLENEQSFTYVTAHSPTLPLLHLRHSSFSNPSFASPTSQGLHLRHLASRPWLLLLLIPEFCKYEIANFVVANLPRIWRSIRTSWLANSLIRNNYYFSIIYNVSFNKCSRTLTDRARWVSHNQGWELYAKWRGAVRDLTLRTNRMSL